MTKRILDLKGSRWMAVLALAICLVIQTAWAKNPKDVVYVIGDSLSDPGNLYALTGSFPPSPPYDYRFSNGPVWAEYFAEQLRVKLESLAYGGAFTGMIMLPHRGTAVETPFSNYDSYEYYLLLPPDLPGVKEEVEGLLASHPEGLNPNALYVVWAGANDFFAALENPLLFESIVTNAASNIASAICGLSAAGARHFAVGNLPDIGLTPLAEGNRESLTFLSVQFNQALAQALTALPLGCAETLVVLDAFQFIQSLVSQPTKYGLENVTTPCISLGPGADCSKYLFWDTAHPTTKGHALFAERFRAEFCGTGNQHPGLRGRPNGQPPPIWRGACYGSK